MFEDVHHACSSSNPDMCLNTSLLVCTSLPVRLSSPLAALHSCPNPTLHPEILQGWVSDARSVAMCRRGLQAVYNAANEAIVQGSGSAPGGAGYVSLSVYL